MVPIHSSVHACSLVETLAAVRSGLLVLAEIVDTACDRIDAVEPVIHALLPEPGRRERLRLEAAALAARYPVPREGPPLYGALLGVKDIFHATGFATRAGSKLPPDALAGAEGPCVTRLREAGALVLGKTHTTEFAFFEPGPTRNPHDPRRTPGGSSSGSAAAVAAGYCPFALGSQTIGSIVRPAAYCGIVGLKPTFGRIETVGVIPFSSSADHIGLFAQDVRSVAAAAAVAVRDWRSPGPVGSRAGALGEAPVGVPVGSPVVGVPVGPYLDQAPLATRDAFASQLERLAASGVAVRRVRVMEDVASINRRHRSMIAAEMAGAHEAWLAPYGDLYRPRTLALIREGQAVSADALAAGRAGRERLRAQLTAAMDDHGLDLWLSPSSMGAAELGLASTGDPAMNLPWTHAGLPTLTIPAGRTAEGMPLGLQIVGRWMADEQVVAWAEVLELIASGRTGQAHQ